MQDFNPRSPGESDKYRTNSKKNSYNFNPRSPGESDFYDQNVSNMTHNFNPRSPGESDAAVDGRLQIRFYISIHALLGRATQRAKLPMQLL